MFNKYTYLGIWLLSVASLSSCNNEELIDYNSVSDNLLHTYTLSANVESTENSQQSRANIKGDGKSFFWNTGDELTLWNGKEGYTFKAVDSYNESSCLRKVEFTGKANLEEGQTVWGVYPKNETASTLADALTFSLPEIQTQANAAPSLQKTMFMYSKGSVSKKTIANMNFKHLTGVMHFALTNKRERTITIEYISVKANAEVFPYQASVNEDGIVAYSNTKNEMKLIVNQSVNNAEVFNGYINILPTEKMNENTELIFTVKLKDDDSETELKKGKVSELYAIDTPFAKDGYKYIAGKRYGISKSIQPTEGDTGYTEDGNNSYSVFSTKGFTTLMEDNTITGKAETKIILTQDLDFKGTKISSIAKFKGTLDGNNKKLSNIQLEKVDNKLGLFISNEGTIKNLNIENITIANTDASIVGLLAAENTGTISSCNINNVTVTLKSTANGSDAGLVVGKNLSSNAVIENITICRSSLTIENGKTNLGGISGQNGSWNASTIKGCSLKDVTITCKDITNNSAVGGLVGWNCGGKVFGNSSNAIMKSNVAANYGGLIGANDSNGIISGSYCCGRIEVSFSGSRVGGIIANNNSKIEGCYSSVHIENPDGKVGGLIGENNNNITNCYIINCNKAVGTGSNSGAEVLADSNSLIGKMESLNSTINSLEYQYIKNETASEKEPLVLKKK